MAHVNHAMYFTYMEVGRLHYVRDVLGWAGGRSPIGAILARIECDYKFPLLLGDSIRVYVRVCRIGSKSFDFEHIILRESDKAEAARGTAVLVAYDYEAEKSIPLPAEWREQLLAFEPGFK